MINYRRLFRKVELLFINKRIKNVAPSLMAHKAEKAVMAAVQRKMIKWLEK